MSGKVSLTKREDSAPEQPAPAAAPSKAAAAAGESIAAAREAAPNRLDGMTLVLARNSFYAQASQRMMLVFLGQLLLIVALVVVITKLFHFTDSRDYFFPAQTDNTIIIERPLSEPVFSNEQIRSWVENAVTRTMTFGFYDHLLRLQQSRSFFTTEGWAGFTKAMDDSQIFERIGAVPSSTIRASRQVVTARLRSGSRADIKQSGVLKGRYSWKIDLIVDVSFSSPATQTRDTWKIEVLVTRLPTMESREGIGIAQLLAEVAQ